ncbi:MAG: hypothetical protein KDD82_22230 [Planctomycetes bacterium]|nr:hypothetical protein [Planctomycetota bacterium]
MPRGSRPGKKAKLIRWKNKKGSHGRRPGLGKRPAFMSWDRVRTLIKRNQTVVIPPAKPEAAAATAEGADS